MTDKPTTLALNARQWRVLMNDHLEVLKAGVGASEVLDEAGLKNVVHHLEQIRLMAGAWYQNSPAPAVADAVNQQAQPEAMIAAAATNGAGKRTGGWPKGKPRKQRMNPAQAASG